MKEIPQIQIGPVGNPKVNWRLQPVEEDPDDEELAETPAEIVAVLGFDPAEGPR